MIINDERSSREEISATQMEPGEVYEWGQKKFVLATMTRHRVVDLNTGEIIDFSHNAKVVRVSAELTIDD